MRKVALQLAIAQELRHRGEPPSIATDAEMGSLVLGVAWRHLQDACRMGPEVAVRHAPELGHTVGDGAGVALGDRLGCCH